MTRKVKRYLIIFIITFAVLGITARAYCYSAEAVSISGRGLKLF